MKNSPNSGALRSRRRRRALGSVTALATLVALVGAGGAAVQADEQAPDADVVSAAHGHGLYADLVGLDLAATATSRSAHDDQSATDPWPETDSGGLDLSVLGLDVAEALGLSGGVQLPLVQEAGGSGDALLALGDLDALVSYSDSPSDTESTASSGIVGDGSSAVNLDPTAVPAGYEPTTLDLAALLGQVLPNQTVIDDASIEIGALGATASQVDGELENEYMVAGLEANVHSPLVGDLTDVLTTAVNNIVAPINGLVAEDGLVDSAIGGLSDVIDGVDTRVLGIGVVLNSDSEASGAEITGLDTLVTDTVNDLLQEEISNGNGSVFIDLSTGLIHLDLAELVIEDYNTNNPDGEISNLSELPANTDVLTSGVVASITNGVTEALSGNGANSLTTKLQTLLSDNLWNTVGIDININATGDACLVIGCTTLVAGEVVIDGTLAEFAGYGDAELTSDNISTTLDLLGAISVGELVNLITGDLLAPIVNDVAGPLLTIITDDVLGNVQSLLHDAILAPVLTPVINALQPLLNGVANITINEQPTEATPSEPGDLGAESFTVRALSVELLPLIPANLLRLELGSASVLAADEAVATITASPDTAVHGEVVTITGKNFTPAEGVIIVFPDGTNGTPTADADGDIGVDSAITWTVPADQDPGTVTFTATGQDSGSVAQDTVEVIAVTLSATDAPQGGTVTLTGGGFAPDEAVTIDLPDGTTGTDTADADGNFTFDWEVPETQAPGVVDFTATGDSSDRTADATAEITLAVATLTASPNPVEPNATVTVTGGNFAPGEAITITVPSDCVVGGTLPTNAGADGTFTFSCVVDAGTTDGTVLTFSATGDESGRSATAVTAVEEEVPADANTNASASAAASADAAADGDATPAAEAAAEAAALPDADTTATAAAEGDASAAAEVAARADVVADASTTASADSTTDTNASAQAAATSSSDSTAGANADADAAASVDGDVDSRAAAQAAANTAATADSSNDASADASADINADANASASASASARANGDEEAAAQAASEAAAYAENESDASAAADVTAAAAADVAAYTDVDADASATASADVTTDANSAAQAAATAVTDTTADATASADQNADSDAAGDNSADFDSASSARAAAQNAATADASGEVGASADASQEAAAEVQANANASASASASADADDSSNPAAQVAAQAAALADASSAANAAADVDASAAAEAAARPNVDADATATAAENAESAALAAALTTADTSSVQDAQQTAAADVNAEAASAASAEANASVDASSLAAADVNAAASASASAEADSNANAAAIAASETSAMADATTTASADTSAAATADAEAAAQAASQVAARADVRTTASANASQDTTVDANAASNATAQASADNSADVQVTASAAADASAEVNSQAAAQAAAEVAANADSTATAAATAAATALADVDADASSASSSDSSAATQAAAEGSAEASGDDLARTGAMNGAALAAVALLLLVLGGAAVVMARRRSMADQS